MTFQSLEEAFSRRSPLDLTGTAFTLTLTGFREPLPHETQQIHVAFSAVNTTGRHNGELHVGVDRFTEDEIADIAVDTIREIASGRLPPGTVSPV